MENKRETPKLREPQIGEHKNVSINPDNWIMCAKQKF
jgi:hypothetical protein